MCPRTQWIRDRGRWRAVNDELELYPSWLVANKTTSLIKATAAAAMIHFLVANLLLAKVSAFGTQRKGVPDPSHLLQTVDKLIENGNSQTSCDDRFSILSRIDGGHRSDAMVCSLLPKESKNLKRLNQIPYKWICTKSDERPYPLAAQTLQPILERHEIDTIRSAFVQYLAGESQSPSRFTLQRNGNSEAHLNDLAGKDGDVTAILEKMFQERVYPLVRELFGDSLGEDIASHQLCAYDALFIRYNATEANLNNQDGKRRGAGQPLHRDKSMVSVNVMLNSEFRGGGTFFENQLRTDREKNIDPLKPIGPGHALCHLSSERHAGAETHEGVREILVLFLTAQREEGGGAPVQERCTRLKATAREMCEGRCESTADAALCRAKYQRLAIEAVPCDGEAWQYLGMALRDMMLSPGSSISGREILQNASINCLMLASYYNPCDGRVYNNIALSFAEIYMESPERNSDVFELVVENYQMAANIYKASQQVGCDVGKGLDAALLNHGLFLANLDLFREASQVLSKVSDMTTIAASESTTEHQTIVMDAEKLRRFCDSRLADCSARV